MRLMHRFTTVFFVVLLTALLGCAETPTQEGTGQYVDDTVITTRIKSAIFGDPGLKSAEINVETYKGVVQLSGFVRSQKKIDKAVKLASEVPGVTSVKNAMRRK